MRRGHQPGLAVEHPRVEMLRGYQPPESSTRVAQHYLPSPRQETVTTLAAGRAPAWGQLGPLRGRETILAWGTIPS